jgi:hypothetical protein
MMFAFLQYYRGFTPTAIIYHPYGVWLHKTLHLDNAMIYEWHYAKRTILHIFAPQKRTILQKSALFHLILERVQTVALAFDGAGELVART